MEQVLIQHLSQWTPRDIVALVFVMGLISGILLLVAGFIYTSLKGKGD